MMDGQVKVKQSPEMEMTTRIIHPSLTCEEEGTSGSLNFGNDCFKLTHRKSFKIHICSTRSNSFPARALHCIKCNSSTTPSLNYRHHDELCNKCALRLKRWGSLAVMLKTLIRWKALVVADGTTLVGCLEDENKSGTCCVSDKEHPSSPGDPQIVEVEPGVNFCSREFLTGSDSVHIEQTLDSEGNNYFSCACAPAANLMLKGRHAITMATISVTWSWVFFKWLIKVINVLFEVGQAVMDQENGESKVSGRTYRWVSFALSLACLIISLIEIIGEGRARKVVWQKKCWCYWFWYPGDEGRVFVKFSLYFGVLSSGAQFSINLISLIINESFVKFCSVPPLLAFGHLVAALTDSGEQGLQAVCPRCEKETPLLGITEYSVV